MVVKIPLLRRNERSQFPRSLAPRSRTTHVMQTLACSVHHSPSSRLAVSVTKATLRFLMSHGLVS